MQTLQIDDLTITVREVLVEDLPAVGVAIAPFITAFDKAVDNDKGTITNSSLFKLCTEYSPDIVNLCCVMTDIPREKAKKLKPKQLLELTEQIILLSQDFFLTQLAKPMLKIGNAINTTALQLALSQLSTTPLNTPSNS